jgi:NADPH:quinone reductase-like Zn-dependent oxidoreductase
MKAIIKAAAGMGNVELAKRPVPEINENEVLIKSGNLRDGFSHI